VVLTPLLEQAGLLLALALLAKAHPFRVVIGKIYQQLPELVFGAAFALGMASGDKLVYLRVGP
jgi:hypothetical protein